MECPYCLKGDTKVIDSRNEQDNPFVIRRRRRCFKCQVCFTTRERLSRSRKNPPQDKLQANISMDLFGSPTVPEWITKPSGKIIGVRFGEDEITRDRAEDFNSFAERVVVFLSERMPRTKVGQKNGD